MPEEFDKQERVDSAKDKWSTLTQEQKILETANNARRRIETSFKIQLTNFQFLRLKVITQTVYESEAELDPATDIDFIFLRDEFGVDIKIITDLWEKNNYTIPEDVIKYIQLKQNKILNRSEGAEYE